MGIANGKEILTSAQSQGIAIGGFDVFNVVSAQAVAQAADKLATPVFLQAGSTSAHHMGVVLTATILREVAGSMSVPTTVHLDHGAEGYDMDLIRSAIEAGFTSVMVDGSRLSLKENIALTRKVIGMAHPQGVCVEGELGQVSRNTSASEQEIRDLMTKPEEAKEYVETTGVDYLAVSIGSVSGFFRGRIKLDFERLRQIREAVDVPLVIHGGTSIPSEEMAKAVRIGICKANIAHALRKAFCSVLFGEMQRDPDQVQPHPILEKARDRMKEVAEERIKSLKPAQEA